MNIAVDVQPVVSESRFRGMGVYSIGLLNALFEQDRQNRYFLYNMYAPVDIKQILTYGTNVSYDYFHMGKTSSFTS